MTSAHPTQDSSHPVAHRLSPDSTLLDALSCLLTQGLASVPVGEDGPSLKFLGADTLTWSLALGLHAVAFVRLLADLLPAGQAFLLALAGIGWLAVFTPLAMRLAPIYLSRRADGKAG